LPLSHEWRNAIGFPVRNSTVKRNFIVNSL
jgi:hypothetical protein